MYPASNIINKWTVVTGVATDESYLKRTDHGCINTKSAENSDSWFTAQFKNYHMVTKVEVLLDQILQSDAVAGSLKILIGDTECGTMPSSYAPLTGWVTVDCPSPGIVGEGIRIEKDTEEIIFCGLKVYGYVWGRNINTMNDIKASEILLKETA